MSDTILSCGSTADLTEEYLKELDVRYIPYRFFIDGVEYRDDLGKTVPFEEFYDRMRGGADVKTSQPNIAEYLDYFEELLGEGKDVLHIAFSSGLSGACQSAMSAAEIAGKRHPDRKIFVVDSLCASSGYGLLMAELAERREKGAPIESLYETAIRLRYRVHHWFFSTDLTSYVKGGRISKAAGLFGGVLGICPLLKMDGEGKLVPVSKCRSKRKAVKEAAEKMKELAEGGAEYAGRCFICHSDCMEDAVALSELITQSFPKLMEKPQIFSIGTTIGCHSGPGTAAVFFVGEDRRQR